MNGIDVRQTLADNLEKLRNASVSLKSYPAIAKHRGPSNGTLGRIALKEQGATVDVVSALAAVFGLRAWQILVPTLEAKSNGTNHPAVSGLPGWPFPKVPQAKYDKLEPDDQVFIQGAVMAMIERLESDRPPKHMERIK